MIRPEVLLLASKFDFTCDHVSAELHRLGASYFRLNVEDLPESRVACDPLARRVTGRVADIDFHLAPDALRSIYYRQPVFLRSTSGANLPPHEVFAREQWATFIRSFMLFDQCRWINHPAATYVAEHKAIQLYRAAEFGFDVPATRIANTPAACAEIAGQRDALALKGLDTVFVRDDSSERFGYTQLVTPADLTVENLAAAPAILQQALREKTDLRVTIVRDQVWCAEITRGGEQIVGDWRLQKDNLNYRPFMLPNQIAARCVSLVQQLGLVFGAIDLALVNDRYFFLEINPTGEWAWLAATLAFPIARAIADELVTAEIPVGDP